MIKNFKVLGILLAAIFLLTGFHAEAHGTTNWNSNKITVIGQGVPSSGTYGAQAKLLAKRAAVVDAYRQLAEIVHGVNVDAETTVEQMMVSSDIVRTTVEAKIKGARIVDENITSDGIYEVTVEMPLFGTGGIADVVIERPQSVISFPEPEYIPEPITPPTYTPPAPSGKYTGVIIDCRGFRVNPVMSPVIKNSRGKKLYGHENLDYDYIIEHGMVSYADSMSQAGRAGSNPLIIKAERMDDFNANPVISVQDGNFMLSENRGAKFLDKTAVVFLY